MEFESGLTENSAYKIHLATAEGLGNKSPVEYSIHAEPDLVPTIEPTKPWPRADRGPRGDSQTGR